MSKGRSCFLVVVFWVCAAALHAQHRVDAHLMYHRVIAVLPLQGAGTNADPVRPKYAPLPSGAEPSRTGIIGFAFEPSDNGKFAIAEFVAVNRAALVNILNDHTPGVLVFEKGVTEGSAIEAAIRVFRKDFSLQNFGVTIQ